MQNVSYNTKQKSMLIDIIKRYKASFTIKDIHEKVPDIGLTTIYRLIDKLVEKNEVAKTINKDNIAYYSYLGSCSNDNHFFLKCERCGHLEHVDCDCIKSLTEHILKNHNFAPNKDQIIINGICPKCNKKENI